VARLRELSLFSGIGGSSLAGELTGAWRTVCAVEAEPFCREVLLRRQQDGLLPLFPIWDRIETFDGCAWRGVVDLVSAGWPCPPVSLAGRGRGEDDERWLWPEVVRVLREARPRWFLGENVRGLLSANAGREFGTVLRDLAELGFHAWWGVLSAAAVGAPHLRERVWLVADAHGGEVGIQPQRVQRGAAALRADRARDSGPAADADGRGREEHAQRHGGAQRADGGARGDDARGRGAWDWREAPPGVCGVDARVPHRVDRLRGLGNAWVPQQAAEAWRRLT